MSPRTSIGYADSTKEIPFLGGGLKNPCRPLEHQSRCARHRSIRASENARSACRPLLHLISHRPLGICEIRLFDPPPPPRRGDHPRSPGSHIHSIYSLQSIKTATPDTRAQDCAGSSSTVHALRVLGEGITFPTPHLRPAPVPPAPVPARVPFAGICECLGSSP